MFCFIEEEVTLGRKERGGVVTTSTLLGAVWHLASDGWLINYIVVFADVSEQLFTLNLCLFPLHDVVI